MPALYLTIFQVPYKMETEWLSHFWSSLSSLPERVTKNAVSLTMQEGGDSPVNSPVNFYIPDHVWQVMCFSKWVLGFLRNIFVSGRR